MRFTVEVNVTEQPEVYEKYYRAFINSRPLDTGSKVVGIATYLKEPYSGVYCAFLIRS